MMRIGLLLGEELSDFRIQTLKLILEDRAFNVVFAIIDKRPEPSIKDKIRNNLKRGRGGYILIMAFKSIFSRKESFTSSNIFCENHDIDILETNSPYSDNNLIIVKSYNLDTLLLVGGFGIVKKAMLEIVPNGVLSYHHGDMSKYRGMPPALWELYNNEQEMGITVQKLVPGLDCGIPIVVKKIKIENNDSLKSLYSRALEESIPMLHESLLKLLDKNFNSQKLERYGPVYTLPNLTQWFRLNIILAIRKRKHPH